MKTGNATLLVAAGIVLLWVVTSGRTKNLASAWATLLQLPQTQGSVNATASGGVNVPGFNPNDLGNLLPPGSTPTLPSPSGGGFQFPPGDTLPSGDFLSSNMTPSLASHFSVPGSGTYGVAA